MQKTLTAIAASLLLTACANGPLGDFQRVWPDGASVTIRGLNVTASMTGAGSITAQEVSWVGTNGFPNPGTNATVTTVPPSQFVPLRPRQ